MMKKASTSILFTLATAASFYHSSAFPMQQLPQHRPLHTMATTALHMSSAAAAEDLELSPELQTQWNQKNASRKKFGLDPLSVSEFMELQAEVAEMHQQQELKYAQQQSESASTKQQQQQQPSFMSNFAKGLLEDTCMSSFDCEAPKVCCDLGVKKMCCSNGALEVTLEYAYATVPVDIRE